MSQAFVSTRVRLAVSISLLVMSVLSGYLLIHYLDLRSSLKQELSGVAEATASRLSRQLAAPLWSINEQQISSTVESEMTQHALAAVEILDPLDKRTLFERRRESIKPGFLFSQQDADAIMAETAVVTEAGEQIGVAVVHVSPAFMHNSLVTVLSRRAIELLLLGALLVAASLLMIRLHLLVPLQRATAAICSNSESELDELIRGNRNRDLDLLLRAVGELRGQLGNTRKMQGK
ncbi:hypothetical protein [Sedimenticola hydrogenitrophicus]|uniref:hypothetical protein n=1 Tax=Sedimenticola hydrogenitrophicus TaxID=2967975 RepID=UPI0023AFF55C|nr:hypothetical protein [Sedimenticola hydrogenitrophicus]